MGTGNLVLSGVILLGLAGLGTFFLSHGGESGPALPAVSRGGGRKGIPPAPRPIRGGAMRPASPRKARVLSLREKLLRDVPPGYELPPGEPRLDRDDEGNIYYVFPDDTVISPRVRPFTLPGGKVVWRKVIQAGGPMKKERGVDPKDWEFRDGRWVKKRGR